MTRDEQARQRLVNLALHAAEHRALTPLGNAFEVRTAAGFKDPSKGSWCAAGLTAAMAKAGLLVPAPGTPARRGAIALLDWVARSPGLRVARPDADGIPMYFVDAQPGDIIAWLQHPPPDPAGWRRGHVAVIVATDSESITTVGWNEGPSPGRVMMRRLWRDRHKRCTGPCDGSGYLRADHGGAGAGCPACNGRGEVPPAFTVLARKQGLLYGIARPVAA